MRQKFFTMLMLLTLLATLVPVASGAASTSGPKPEYKLPNNSAPTPLAEPIELASYDRLATASETSRMWIHLADPSLVELMNAKGPMTPAAELSYVNILDARQTAVARQAAALGAVELARINYLVNVIAVRVPTSRLAELRALPGVAGVYPVVDGELQLEHSAERIGALYAQDVLGFDGTGITIGIVDSGVDYTHAAFGGPGTELAYTIATSGTNGAVITDTFAPGWVWPTDTIKVVGGYDFTGPVWDRGLSDDTLSPDPDPIDDGPSAGHGTNVASIAAGWEVVSDTETLVYAGIAPEAEIRAYKVCSSNSSACNGIAILQGIDQAAMDGVDVINFSIGGDYASYASEVMDLAMNAAADTGVLIAVSAGNAGNAPYILGTPSSADGVLSVAASFATGQENPGFRVDAPASIADTYKAFEIGDALEPTTEMTAKVVYAGEGCSADDYPPGVVITGTIALISRGTCFFSAKGLVAESQGAIAAIIFNNTSGSPNFGFFGVPVSIPVVAMTQADGLTISAVAASETVTGTLGPSIVYGLPELEDTIVDYSSRGPRSWDNAIKPQITAPGPAVYSADVGSGNQASLFGGTSSASPHVAGTMILMRQAFPTWSVDRIYNALMNNAFTELYLQEDGGNPNYGGTGTRAPVARQGAGLVQVDDALESTTVAWDAATDIAALSYGYAAVSDTWVMTKTVRVWNSRETGTPGLYRTYDIAFTNIFTDDETAGVMVEIVPAQIHVTDGMSTTFDVILHVDAAGLKEWPGNTGGYWGDSGDLLTYLEFDGYVTIEEVFGGTGMPVTDEIVLPLLLLPHKSADVMADQTSLTLDSYSDTATLTLNNSGAYTGTTDIYDWMVDDPTTDVITDHLDIDMVGVSASGDMFEFVVATEGARAHPIVASFEFSIDTDGDGMTDYWAWNEDYFGDGTSLVLVQRASDGALSIYFYATTHLNAGVVRLPVWAGQLGLDSTNMDISFYVSAWDWYYGGYVDDAPDAGWASYDGNNPKFYVDNPWPDVVGSKALTVSGWQDGHFGSPDQLGLLAVYDDQAMEAEGITINVTDPGASTCPVEGRTDVGVLESFDVTFSTAVSDTDSIEFTLQRMGPIGTGTLEFPDLEVAWSMTNTVATVSTDIPANGILMVLGQAYELSHDGGAGADGTVFPANDWYFVYANRILYLPLMMKASVGTLVLP